MCHLRCREDANNAPTKDDTHNNYQDDPSEEQPGVASPPLQPIIFVFVIIDVTLGKNLSAAGLIFDGFVQIETAVGIMHSAAGRMRDGIVQNIPSRGKPASGERNYAFIFFLILSFFGVTKNDFKYCGN